MAMCFQNLTDTGRASPGSLRTSGPRYRSRSTVSELDVGGPFAVQMCLLEAVRARIDVGMAGEL
jgi:hypothetical protein